MKGTIIAFLLVLNIGIAYGADKTITSETYVTNQLATKQEKIPAVDTKTVITHTGSLGEVGEKGIYDSTGNYATQQTSLVTAGDANTGINNALENEFVCVSEDTDHTCLLWSVKNTSPQQILPTGYTALEYFESTGTQYITTTIPWTSVTRFRGKAQQSASSSTNKAVIGSSTLHDSYGCFWGTAYWSLEGGIQEWYWNTRISPTTIANFDIHRSGDVDWAGVVNGVTTSTLTATRPQSAGYYNFIGDVIILGTNTPGRNRQFNGKVWYIQLFDNNGVQIFSGVPARRDSDSVLGMYDLVSNTFFTNAGSGTFIAGPVLNVYIPSGD